MNTIALKSIVRLFSITSLIPAKDDQENHEVIINEYLSQYTGTDEIFQFIGMYAFYRNQLKKKESSDFHKRISSLSVKSLQICYQLIEQLSQKERLILLSQLLEILKSQLQKIEIFDYISTISKVLRIEELDFNRLFKYVLRQDVEGLLIYTDSSRTEEKKPGYVNWRHLKGEIHLIYFDNIKTCFFYIIFEDDHITLNDQKIKSNKIYSLNWGETIRSFKFKPIIFSDVIKEFHNPELLKNRKLIIKDLEYSFQNGLKGMHPFNLDEETGQLIGIIGGSGTGKTTLLNLLNGNLKPEKGNIYINGKDLHNNLSELKSLIGYVPQDELLLEDLTVYQNLYFNAKLCFGDKPEEFIISRVYKILKELQLENIKDLTVGNPLQKVISGGQRKRINIALELMREPSVFMVDEPTSGLSSNDSLKVMSLLKEQTFKGKMVFVNIHQPSSEIYKMFDKIIVLDKGGYVIYQGNPLDAIVYFKEKTNQIGANIRECVHCGNVKPEQILEIIEHPKIDEFGNLTSHRAIEPKDWYDEYKKSLDPVNIIVTEPEKSQEQLFNPPKSLTQFNIFFKRNFLSKIQDKQYLLISLLEAPMLAAILGYFSRYAAGTEENPAKYIFLENSSMPVYFFMSVIVALFIGLIVSAEQIIQDQKIINREKFLSLSRTSYLNSKISFLFLLSAVQMLLYVIIGNFIVGLKGMNFTFWLVLFTIACNANMMGLNISAGLKSLIAIYVLVPLLIVPQLLLSGSAIKFDKLPKSLSSDKYVPLVGDLMVSRWAYEALLVDQFKKNKYNNNFYVIDKELSKINYKLSFLIPEIEWRLMSLKSENEKDNNLDTALYSFVDSEINKHFDFEKNNRPNKLVQIEEWDENLQIEKTKLSKIKINLIKYRDKQINELRKNNDPGYLVRTKEIYHNQAIDDLVTAKDERNKFVLTENGIIQKADPVYEEPLSNFGRAHFFAPVKIAGKIKVDTLWFNIFVIWLITFFLYFALINDSFRKFSELSINKIYVYLKKLF